VSVPLHGLVVLAADDPTSHVLPHPVLEVAGHPISNQLLMLFVAAALMLVAFPLVARRRDAVPTGMRNLLESVLQYLRENVARPALRESTDRFVPFVWTVFFLVLIANLLGALPIDPIVSLIAGRPVHVGGTATGNLSITAGLAICSFVAIHVGGILEQGLGHYLKNFAPHVPWPMLFLLIPLEILAAVVKPFSLAVRLFANMVAGHLVLAVLLGFTALLSGGVGALSVGVSVASVVGATVISLLELFVAFLQAFIFTFLTTLFIGMAVHPEH
jgi:F-type H+-transporting ATPase subunit a